MRPATNFGSWGGLSYTRSTLWKIKQWIFHSTIRNSNTIPAGSVLLLAFRVSKLTERWTMDFLHAAVDRQQYGVESSFPSAEGRDVIVIGTGNTASDCVATSIRQGCRSVLQLVRRGREDYLDSTGNLPKDYAQEEAAVLYGQDPRVFRKSIDKLQTDNAGNLCAVITKSGEQFPCQLLIGATGFAGCRADICEAFGIERDHTVVTKAGHFSTNIPHIFSAGDMHRGQSLVVHAIAEGRAAAVEVDQYLMGYTNLVSPL